MGRGVYASYDVCTLCRKRCEVNDKYYVLSVPGIKEKNADLESVNWLWLLYTRGYVMLTGR